MTPIKPKKFIDPFKLMKVNHIDYKDSKLLAGFITYYRSIQSRFHTGVSLKNQRKMATAIKNARFMALLPYVRYGKTKQD